VDEENKEEAVTGEEQIITTKTVQVEDDLK